jgi:glyoxylase-like metal-dependent hydrolase (beta-lactamase superfamily II)
MHTIRIGAHQIIALSDGMSRPPPTFYPGLDIEKHPELLDRDGTVHIPTGSFLLRSPGATILIDAGLGPTTIPLPDGSPMSQGGLLPNALATVGYSPTDIDLVFLTHLHPDHIGWIAPHGEPYFPNAEVVYGAADWDLLADKGMHVVRAAGRTRPLTEPAVALTEGVTARHTPGHTPGSYILIATAGDDSAYLLGDLVHHPLQLTNPNITFATDTDAALATQTRAALFRELEDATAIGMAHINGFHRITRTWHPVQTRIPPRAMS